MNTPNPVDVLNQQIAELRTDIRAAEDAQTLRAVCAQFEYVRPWWQIAGFGSTADMLRIAIYDKACDLRAEERDYLANARRNDARRCTTERNITALAEIIESMAAN